MDTQQHFDVVIMGGGIAGNFQARHLLLNIPGITVAVVEPRSDARIAEVGKIGESTVEIAGMFMTKELGLGDYLVERHLPKDGLNFHWPKNASKTDSVDDYYSVWALRQPLVHAWQIHRGRLELDLKQMNIDHGAAWFHAAVSDLDITPGDALNRVHIRSGEGDEQTLTCTHVVDAAGRAFLTGRKFDNILQAPEHRFDVNNGAAWVRVKGVKRRLFRDPDNTANGTGACPYYATNHWLGAGHWLWMIPLSREDMTLSLGMMHHHDVIPGADLNSRDKFLAFLEANHRVLYDLIVDADEIDFMYWGKPAHICKQAFSEDNWCAIGDAIFFADAFYSVGISAACVQIECATELIRAHLAREPQVARKRTAYNDYILWFAATNAHMYRHHARHLGNASIMSWRIYFEYIWWFGSLVPAYIGKWHLDPDFIAELLDNCPRHFHEEVYEEFNELIDRGANIGFQDCYRADQIPGEFHPTQDHLPYLENTWYEPGSLNIYRSVAATHAYAAKWWAHLQKTAHGPGWMLRERGRRVYLGLLKQAARIRLRAALHDVQHALGRPRTPFEVLQDDFASYRAPVAAQPWMAEIEAARAARKKRGRPATS